MYRLPEALAPLGRYNQFILVQLLPATDARGQVIPGKSVKHPVHPTTFSRHNAHDPAIWMDWEHAARVAAFAPLLPGMSEWRVGFVITANDPFGCVDMDACSTLTGAWSDTANDVMAMLPSANELSVSGTGLHDWFMYQGVAPAHGKRNTNLNLEMYTELRFIVLGNSASGAMADMTAHLPQFIAKYFPPGADLTDSVNWTTTHDPEHTPLSDDDLLRLASRPPRLASASSVFGGVAPTHAPFADLWAGKPAVMAQYFPAQSPGKPFGQTEADFALAKELAYWTGKNCERMADLMQRSGLKRDKWLPSVHKTYFRDTIMNACAACQSVYQSKVTPLVLPPAPPPPPAEEGFTYLAPKVVDYNVIVGRDELAPLFAQCVYIQDLNGILTPSGDVLDQARFNAKFAGRVFVMDDSGKAGKTAWEAFLSNQMVTFPRVEATCFDPRKPFQSVVERAGRQWVNIYRAPKVDRRAGDVEPFMRLLRTLLPNGDDALILLSYMAAVVQNPGVKFRWAPFIQGTQGNGKSTLVQCLRKALGEKYIFPIKAGMIENGFNAWLENHVLYVADDIYSTKDRNDMMEALKSMITEAAHAITLKGVDSITKIICGNFIFTDNHKDAMKKQDETRRICTLYCAQQSKWDRMQHGLTKEYFAKLHAWLDGGGYAHVAEMLATMDIDPRYNPAGECQEAPETSVTKEAIIDSRTGLEHEIAEWIELQEPGFAGDFVSQHVLRSRMQDNPQYSRQAQPLKIKEHLERLGYMMHPHLPQGRSPIFTQPDGTRPILFVKRDSYLATITDPETVATLYHQAQQEAQRKQTELQFMGKINVQ